MNFLEDFSIPHFPYFTAQNMQSVSLPIKQECGHHSELVKCIASKNFGDMYSAPPNTHTASPYI